MFEREKDGLVGWINVRMGIGVGDKSRRSDLGLQHIKYVKQGDFSDITR